MATRADDIIDRRRLRRKLTFWRAVTVALVAIGLLWASGRLFPGALGTAADHIAQVRIEGTITEDDDLLDLLERVRKAPAVKGVMLTIDSPGGTTVGGEALYEEIRRIAAEKPVVAQVGTLAASAGYMIATAADHIVARRNSIIGSIGVLVQYPDITGLMDKVGVKLEEVKSSPLKAEPSPFNPTTDRERAMVRSMIMDSYDWFVDLVAARRPLSREEVVRLADGTIFTGRQAKARKLIDALGGEEAAKAWLIDQGLDDGLQIIEWKPDRSDGYFLPNFAMRALARYLGLPQSGEGLLQALGADRIFLDGLLSLWQPEQALSTN